MEEKMIDVMNEDLFAPAEFITLLFERTDEDGVLYIPGWHYDRPGWEWGVNTDENDSYRCRVDWNMVKYEKLMDEFETLYAALKKISQHRSHLDGLHGEKPRKITLETAKEVLKDETLAQIWYTYVRPYEIENIDIDRVYDIMDRWETVEWVKSIAEELAKGKKLDKYQKEILTEYMDIHVTTEEKEYYCKYMDALREHAEQRLGKSICAYEVIFRARRLCRLFELNPPPVILNNEARCLAETLLLHKHGVSKEIVDNNIRLRLERMELMSDEELDELYRPQKTNTRKSMAPLFVYSILKERSNSKNHLRQQDILKDLEKYPYEIHLERKALSRIIHNLTDSQYAVYSDKTGVWMEQE